MSLQTDVYRSLRRESPTLPARFAWERAQDQVVLDRRVEATGFYWRPWGEQPFALWHESGYALRADVEIDDTVWELYGADEIGRFQAHWVPGAIRHSRLNTRVMDWFVPAIPHEAERCYRRACVFGQEWNYICLAVTAMRASVDLGYSVLCGLESDGPENDLTGIAFYLADEAMKEADLKIKQLCTGR